MRSFKTYLHDQKNQEKEELFLDEKSKNKTDAAEEYQLTISKDITTDEVKHGGRQ